jgi:excisionase family DNA binding protein
MAQPRYYTTQQVAKTLGVSVPTVVNWVKQGRLDAHKTPGGHRRISQEALESFCGVYAYPLPGGDTETQSSGAQRVLVVDGERDFGEMVGEYLQLKGGFEVQSSAETLDAGFHLGRFSPHLVVLDLDMEQISGIDIARLVGSEADRQAVRVLGTATFVDSYKSERLSEFGLDAVVAKPVKLDELLAQIQSLLG